MPKDLFDAVDKRIDKRVLHGKSAQVLNVSPASLTVQLLRSKQIKTCLYSGSQVQIGDTCTVEWIPEKRAWVATAIYSKRISPGKAPVSDFEFAPPQGIRALPGYAGAVVVQWNVPVNQPSAIEVQWNDTESETGATIESVTRAGHCIIETTTSIYVRARSVDVNAERSAWTAWVLATPGAGGGFTTGCKVYIGGTDFDFYEYPTFIQWAYEDYDSDTMWSSGSNTRITINTSGIYTISAVLPVTTTSSVAVDLSLWKNGATVVNYRQSPPLSSGFGVITLYTELQLVATDYLELEIFTGELVNSIGFSSGQYPEFIVRRVG